MITQNIKSKLLSVILHRGIIVILVLTTSILMAQTTMGGGI